MPQPKISDAVLWAEFGAGLSNAQIAATHPSVTKQAVAKRRKRWELLGRPEAGMSAVSDLRPASEPSSDDPDEFGHLVDAMLAGDDRVNRLDAHTYARVSEVAARVARARKDAPPIGPTWVEMQEIMQTFTSFVEASFVRTDQDDDDLQAVVGQMNAWTALRFPGAP